MKNISYISFMTQTQYEDYFVNESGDIFSTKFNKVRKLKPRRTNGYLMIAICNNNKVKQMSVHRLVAQTFIPNPQNKPEVNHKNGIKSDNRVQNLEWNTRKENVDHAILNGLSNSIGENNRSAKLTKEQVLKIRQLYSQKKYNQRELGEIYGVKTRTLSDIICKKNWKNI